MGLTLLAIANYLEPLKNRNQEREKRKHLALWCLWDKRDECPPWPWRPNIIA